jgi:tetratricopeptide (TPR) repeat protein
MADLRDAHLMRAAAVRYDAGDLAGAEAACRQILAERRGHVEAIFLLGHVAQQRSLFRDAEAHFRACVKLRPKEPAGYVMLGYALLRQGRRREAMTCIDRGLRLDPHSTRALAAKADALLVGDEPAKARALLEPHVAAGRGGAELAVVLAEVLAQMGDHRAAIDVAAPHAERGAAPPAILYRLGSVLGKAHERVGNYAAAFAAWTRGNAAVRAPFDATAHEAMVDAIIDAFSAERMAKLPRGITMSPRAVFLVGMPRSGTTLLDRIIDAHPRGAGAGETTIIPELIAELPLRLASPRPYPACMGDLQPEHANALGAELDDALARVVPREKTDSARIAEKNLDNYRSIGLLRILLPNASIIHCRRDPVDTCLSCWAEALNPAVHPWATDLRAIAVAHRAYDRIMRHWHDLLGAEILDVEYRALVEDFEQECRRIVAHVGLPWDDACLRFHESGRGALTLSHAQVRKPINRASLDRAARFGAMLDPLREALA